MNARCQYFLDVLITLGVPAAGDIGVCKLVHQHQAGASRDDRIQIHFVNLDAPVHQPLPRDHLQPLQQAFRFLATMGFDQAGRNVDSVLLEALRFQEHLVGLPDSGAITQINFVAAALRFSDQPEKAIGTMFHHPCDSSVWLPAGGEAIPPCGRVNQNVDPFPGVESTPTLPPWVLMISLTMASPRPIPVGFSWPGTR